MVDLVDPLLSDADEDMRECASTALGCLARHLAPDEVLRLIQTYTASTDDWNLQHGRACALRDIVCFGDNADAVSFDTVVACATRLIQSDNVQVQGGGFAVAAAVMVRGNHDLDKLVASIVSAPSASKDLFTVLAVAFSSVAMRRAELPETFVGFAVGLLYVEPFIACPVIPRLSYLCLVLCACSTPYLTARLLWTVHSHGHFSCEAFGCGHSPCCRTRSS